MSKILFVGHYNQSDNGWGNGAINYIRAINSLEDYEVIPRSFSLNRIAKKLPDDIKKLEEKNAKGASICIQNVLPHHLEYDGRFEKNIALCYYETMFSSCGWDIHINQMDELWTPSNYSKKCFETMGVTIPIKVVPIPCDMIKFSRSYDKIDFAGDFIFYTIADLSIRKNLSTLIKAFHCAFDYREPVKLVIKTGLFNKTPKESKNIVLDEISTIKNNLKLRPSYLEEMVICDILDESEIQSIHQSSDCFVNLSHGEAWCVPMFEAACHGNTIIYSDIKGKLKHYDYTNGVQFNPVYGHFDRVFGMKNTFNSIYKADEKWIDVKVDDAANCMRKIYDNGSSLSKTVNLDLMSNFSYNSVGRQIQKCLS
jgi:glycosyltransferase involved in cell wall biosynthesis